MFSLIISIIAVALVVGLATATLYFGGSAYSRYTNSSELTRITNQQHQIQSAVELFKTDHGSAPQSIDQLVSGNYLQQIPSGTWEFSDTFVVRATGVDDDQCLDYNRARGVPIVPLCSDPEYASKSVCCTG